MMARILVGLGLFALGYLVGKEIGRAESIRDQLRGAVDGDERMRSEPDVGERLNPSPHPGAR